MNDLKDDVAAAFKLCNEQRKRIAILEAALRQIADRDTQLPWVACARIARLALGSDSAEVGSER